jgi:hypothetical protein
MSDEDGIRRTIANYCRLFDSKQWDELGKIFAEDASVTSRRGTFTGRADVIRDLKGRDDGGLSRHALHIQRRHHG